MNMQKKLLIIDDDPDYIAGIKSILETANYAVEVAHNPKAGYQLVQSKPFDLVLLDIMMGRGAEGVIVARKIRNDKNSRNIPILFMTSIREQIDFLFPGQSVNPQLDVLEELMEKPIEPKLLLEKVSNLLKLSELKMANQTS
jgi:two-component system alkaline phosphatase synthesis response regulator PhoP